MTNDLLTGKFQVVFSIQVRKIIKKSQDLVLSMELKREEGLVRMTVRLNRPDTGNEDEITRYGYRARELQRQLKEVCESVELKIAEFKVA